MVARDILYPSVSVLLLLSLGTFAYHNIEGWNYLDSLYFSTVTLATVGYGEMTPKTDFGKAFTIGYIIFGVSSFLILLLRIGAHLVEKRLETAYDQIYVNLPVDPINFMRFKTRVVPPVAQLPTPQIAEGSRRSTASGRAPGSARKSKSAQGSEGRQGR